MNKHLFSVVGICLLSAVLLGCGSAPSSNAGSGTSSSGGPGAAASLSVTGVSPMVIPAQATATLTVTGVGFTATSAVQVNGLALPTTLVSATQLTAAIAAGQFPSATALAVSVSDKGSTAAGTANVQVGNPLPVISALSPASALVGAGAVNVMVVGTGFTSATTIQVNGAARTTAYVSGTQVTVTLDSTDATAIGSLSVAAVNPAPAGGTSPAASLAVVNPAPGAIALTPSAISGGGTAGLPLTVAGSVFVPSSTIQIDGTARATTFVSATQLRTSLTAADQATDRTLSVSVVTPAPGGGMSQPAALTVHVNPVPVLTSASASSVVAGTATSLHLSGSGFTASSTALWNGSALSTQFVSSTELMAIVDAARSATAGTATLTVSAPAPGGGTSAPLSIAVLSAIPVLSSVSPATIFRSSASTVLTLQGTGFQPTSTVLWNGSTYATTFISSTQLSIKVLQTDVPTTATATVQVSTPAPGGGTSAMLSLPVYAFKPSITAVRQTTGGTNCQQINLAISGQYFPTSGLAVKLNGTTISVSVGSSTYISAYLPGNLGVIANPQLTVEFLYQDGSISDPFPLLPQTATCITPSTAGTYPGSTLAFDLSDTSLGNGAQPSVTSLTLPAGFTAGIPAPYAIPSRLTVGVASSVLPGSYSLGLQVSGEGATRSLPVSVRSGTPSFFFGSPSYSDLVVRPGGTTTFSAAGLSNYSGDGTADFLIRPTVTGLPSGVTASFQPARSLPGESFTITLKADSTAPLRQNVPITLTGTAEGTTATASVGYTLSVAPAPGSIPNNRTGFTPLGATPASLAYDRVHGLVFASNSVWNRIDVVSAATRAVVQSIPLASPTRMDLSQDSSTLWIGTKSQQVYALNTSTLALTRYVVPKVAFFSNTAPASWTDSELYALSNGNLLLAVSNNSSTRSIVWAPSSNTVTAVNMGTSLLRSGNGSKVFGLHTDNDGCKLDVYSATQASMNTYTIDGGFTGSSYCGTLQASNADGSVLVTYLTAQTLRGIQLVGANGQSLGAFAAALEAGSLSTAEGVQFNPVTFAFSPDGGTLYQTGTRIGRGNLLATYNVGSRTLLGLAPAIASATPPQSSGYGGNTVQAAVDDKGVLIGIQSYGIAWEDTTYFQDFGSGTLSISGGSPIVFTPLSGPLSGGTSYNAYNFFSTQPDAWFNDIRGSASLSGNSLTLTSPAGAAPGPVDIKTISPNGELGYVALGFSYGPAPQQSVYSGSAPAGGAPGTITGFGLPADSSTGSISVGGTSAAITSTVGQYPPWTGEAVPSTYLRFTLPAGRPGYADLQVTTPNGVGTLPRAVFYANSVADYSFSGTPSAVLYDRFHKQAYVITKTSVLPFANGAFQSPLTVPTMRGVVDLRDGALSVDGNYLLVGNGGDGSVAVLNLQSPSASYALPLPDLYAPSSTCTVGPGAIAALSGGKALVLPTPPSPATGSQCGYLPKFATIDYVARTSSTITFLPGACSAPFRAQLQGSADGTLAVVKDGNDGGGCFYVAGTGLVSASFIAAYNGVSISADANLVGADTGLFSSAGDPLSTLAQPPALYATPLTHGYPADSRTSTLRGIHLNASGSLSYQPHAGYFEIIDTLSNSLRMRFSLTETVQDVPDPLAIDEGGRQVFLLTDAGLTVVDMGQAPLSFGHLGTAAPSSGGTVQLRGSGFDATTTATVDKLAATVSFIDENTLNLSLPSLGSGPHTILLTRADGSTLTLRSAITLP